MHGSNSNYTRMALSLVDNHFRQSPASAAAAEQRAPPALATKRLRADSSTSYESGLPIQALTSFRPAPCFKAAASRPSPVSLGAAPVAASTPLQREDPVTVRGPLAAQAAEPPNWHLQADSLANL